MADYRRFKNLLVSVDDRVAVLTLNRPQVLNAVTDEMHDELRDAFTDLGRDPAVNAIIVTGAGRGFCAGFDVRGNARSPDTPGMPPERVGQVTRAILSTPQPVIAAVNGHAVGMGVNVACYCDVVIASDRAKFGDVHVKVAVSPGDGAVALFPMLVGLNKAKELLMTGSIIEAEEAYRLGLAQRLVPHEKLMDEAMALAKRLAYGPQQAIRWTKLLLNTMAWDRVNSGLAYYSALELLSGKHPDHEEAATAFKEKREPKFAPRIQ